MLYIVHGYPHNIGIGYIALTCTHSRTQTIQIINNIDVVLRGTSKSITGNLLTNRSHFVLHHLLYSTTPAFVFLSTSSLHPPYLQSILSNSVCSPLNHELRLLLHPQHFSVYIMKKLSLVLQKSIGCM